MSVTDHAGLGVSDGHLAAYPSLSPILPEIVEFDGSYMFFCEIQAAVADSTIYCA